jgi:Txe/YoeB family toxin of Txe-Axe toxin-antitoxin module
MSRYNVFMERAILYLIYSPALRAFKIGISNLSNRRYSQHRVKGWTIVKYWYFKDRDTAKKVESVVLNTLRNKFPTVHLKKEDMPQHGYTEAFSTRVISSKKVIALINKEIKNHTPQ